MKSHEKSMVLAAFPAGRPVGEGETAGLRGPLVLLQCEMPKVDHF